MYVLYTTNVCQQQAGIQMTGGLNATLTSQGHDRKCTRTISSCHLDQYPVLRNQAVN
jgi:hypothetical protein